VWRHVHIRRGRQRTELTLYAGFLTKRENPCRIKVTKPILDGTHRWILAHFSCPCFASSMTGLEDKKVRQRGPKPGWAGITSVVFTRSRCAHRPPGKRVGGVRGMRGCLHPRTTRPPTRGWDARSGGRVPVVGMCGVEGCHLPVLELPFCIKSTAHCDSCRSLPLI
jgi:hypothetical protein